MGTRHLIAVQIDGAYKIAQYGQWDGNPACTGIDTRLTSTDRLQTKMTTCPTGLRAKEPTT